MNPNAGGKLGKGLSYQNYLFHPRIATKAKVVQRGYTTQTVVNPKAPCRLFFPAAFGQSAHFVRQ
jgi:hypothetical protein